MEFDVKIIRSSRKSFSLSVSAENEIILRCPQTVSESRIKSFLESKKDWLDKITVRNEIKLSLNKPVLEYKEIYVKGEKYPLIISNKNEITESGVYVKNLKQIKNVFVSRFYDEFMFLVRELSLITGLKADSFAVRSYKRRWGCCDSKRKITFNYMLFMLPVRLQKYVIIHELCHTVYFNHSSAFWRLVSEFEPDYKKMREQLKAFDFITNLY